MSDSIPTPITREDRYLAYLCGTYSGDLPAPITREEKYLALLAETNGVGGGVSACGRNLISNSDVEINYTYDSHPTYNDNSTFVRVADVDPTTFIGKTLVLSYFLRRGGTYVNTATSSGTSNRFGMHGTIDWANSETGATATNYPFATYLTAESDGARLAMRDTFTPPNGYDTLTRFALPLQLFAYPDEDNDTCPVWTFARPKLEIGSAATPWSPAPEDDELPTPISRADRYLAYLCGVYDGDLPVPITRKDYFLASLCGVYSGGLPDPITRADQYLHQLTQM